MINDKQKRQRRENELREVKLENYQRFANLIESVKPKDRTADQKNMQRFYQAKIERISNLLGVV